MRAISLVVLISISISFGCGKKAQHTTENQLPIDTPIVYSSAHSENVRERYIELYPEEDTVLNVINDTLSVEVVKLRLNTFVTEDVKYKDSTQIYKFYDYEITLKVNVNNTVISTPKVRKEHFKNLSKEFLNVAILDVYTYKGYEERNQQLLFDGVIRQQDTDWEYRFIHKYDLVKRKFFTEDVPDEEEDYE